MAIGVMQSVGGVACIYGCRMLSCKRDGLPSYCEISDAEVCISVCFSATEQHSMENTLVRSASSAVLPSRVTRCNSVKHGRVKSAQFIGQKFCRLEKSKPWSSCAAGFVVKKKRFRFVFLAQFCKCFGQKCGSWMWGCEWGCASYPDRLSSNKQNRGILFR